MFDVIVIGGGPAGSVAAKRCAEQGLSTLLLEERELPRDKVCTGMVIGALAKNMVAEEFGPIPQQVLTPPYSISRFILQAPGVPPQSIDSDMPIAWRKDLDYWMNQKAKDRGVEIWDRARVTAVSQNERECVVAAADEEGEQELRAKFVIGADGVTSVVRRALFPDLQVRFSGTCVRECYEGALNVDKSHHYRFFPRGLISPRFSVHHKDDYILLQIPLRPGDTVDELRELARQFLAQNFDFNLSQEPLWRDGCLVRAMLYEELFSASFVPARGNVLLAGDAAGLQMPPVGEGIGTALQSGILAAGAISDSLRWGKNTAECYIEKLQPTLAMLEELYVMSKNAEKEAGKGLQAFLETFRAALEQSMEVS